MLRFRSPAHGIRIRRTVFMTPYSLVLCYEYYGETFWVYLLIPTEDRGSTSGMKFGIRQSDYMAPNLENYNFES
jgi:hypothetical protein